MSAPPPIDPVTLPGMVARRARESPRTVAFRFAGEPCTYERLWFSVERFARRLAGRGVGRGDRVLLALPNGPEFFAVFYAIQLAGATAVPVFPGSGSERVADLARLAGARAVVLAEEPASGVSGLLHLTPGSGGSPPPARLPEISPGDIAYVQFTSGSTGDPKGVELSHARVLTNMRQMIDGMEITPAEVFVSWLPVHHDMGLVLMTMVPFLLAAELVLLPASLRRVHRWLEAIERHRATFTAAPDFAWRLALRAAGERRHDLSSLRVALNAAEPVRPRTLADFAERFELPEVMVPGYGLAEATVGVSMWPPGTPVKVDGRGFPSVGRGFPGVELRVVDDEGTAAACEVGEILVRSPANCDGYLDDPEATRRLLEPDGFLHTGDLGYLDADGDLFVVGRRKNVIIQAGRNLAPSEIEQLADELPEVRLAAAVGIDRGDMAGEQAWIFAEVRSGEALPAPDRRRLVVEIVRRVHSRLGLRPGRVLLLRPRTLPLTGNGKVRHRALVESCLDGSLRASEAVLFPDW